LKSDNNSTIDLHFTEEGWMLFALNLGYK
jgi:hypothetical protein